MIMKIKAIMKEKFFFISLVLICFFLNVEAQTASPFLFASAGYEQTVGSYSLSGSIGEVFIQGAESGNFVLNTGFEAQEASTTYVNNVTKEIWNITYTNPISSTIDIKINSTQTQKFVLEVFDLIGKRFDLPEINGKVFNNEFKLDLSGLGSAGIYFIAIYSIDKTQSKILKINKII